MHWRQDYEDVKTLKPVAAERQLLEKITAWLALPLQERRVKRENIKLRDRVRLPPKLPQKTPA